MARVLVSTCLAVLVASLTGVSCDEVNSALLGETTQINCDSARDAQLNPGTGSTRTVNWFYERPGAARTPLFVRDNSTWRLSPGSKFEDRLVLDHDQHLMLQGVRVQDQGTFVCVTQEGEMKTTLEVYALPDKPLIVGNPAYVVIDAEKQMIGTCRSSGSYPEANLTWYRDSEALADKPADGVYVEKSVEHESSGLYAVVATLFHRPAMQDMHAFYHCEVQYWLSHKQLDRKKSEDIKILLNYPSTHLNLTIESPLPPIKQGDNVTLKCVVDGTSELEFTLQRIKEDGSVLEELHVGAQSTFTFAVTRNHTGLYRCSTIDFDRSGDDSLTSNTSMEVNWIEDVAVTVTPPSNHTPPGSYAVMAGASLTMECRGHSNKLLAISWTKDGKLLSQSRRLQLSAVDYTHGGAYACQLAVPSVPGLIESSVVHVSVQGKPHFTEAEVMTAPGKLTMVCSAKGNPRPVITWNVPQKPAESKLGPWEVRSAVAVPYGATQVITECVASNMHGAANKRLFGPTVPPPVSESPPPSPHASATSTSSKTVIIAILIALLIFFLVVAIIFCLCKKYNLCFKNRYSPTSKQTQSSAGAAPDTYMAPPDQDLKEPSMA